MDRYQRVEKPRPEVPINENEIRITTQGKMRNYITYATTMLQEKKVSDIVLKAMGRAINKAVTIVEIIKRRVAGLHQNTAIGSTGITDMWEPLEEGLLPLETTRHVSMITITLSTKELDKASAGYQPPLPADQVKPQADFEYDGENSPRGGRGRGGRDGGRGRGRGNTLSGGFYGGVDGSWGWGRGRGRGQGWGRARGFRGRGRGYSSNFDSQQDGGGYEDTNVGDAAWGSGRGFRGRGRGYGGAVDTQQDTSGYEDAGIGEAQWGRGRGFRGRGRGYGRATTRQDGGYEDVSIRNVSWGRGRGFRGRGRGYGRGADAQQDAGYEDAGFGDVPRGRGRGRRPGRGRGRGRGWGYQSDGFMQSGEAGAAQ